MPRVERWVFDWFTVKDGVAEICLGDGHKPELRGWLDRIETMPHGDEAPTDNYDAYLYDRTDNDLFQGAGMNRDTALVEVAAIYDALDSTGHGRVYAAGMTRLRIENAGPFKRGTIVLIVVVPDA